MKHTSSDGQVLDEIEVGPFYMIGDDNGALAVRQLIATSDDVCLVVVLANLLDAPPRCFGYS